MQTSIMDILFLNNEFYIKDKLDISYISDNYLMNIYVLIFCILLMYLFNIIVGLIPVFNTMRKTPAQILARYDLD